MGYVVKKVRDVRNGKTKVRRRLDGTPYWQLVFENRRFDRPKAIPREQTIHKDQYESLGFDSRFTMQMAQTQCRYLNSKSENNPYLAQSVFLPSALVVDFEQKILLRKFSGDSHVLITNKLPSHWRFTQKMISELKIEPKNYADECFQFYRYFVEMRVSLAYIKKILRTLNAWGWFFSKKRKGYFFEPLKMPRGKLRQEIAWASRNKNGVKGEADPLSPKMLEDHRQLLSEHFYNWLYLSVWLGLRPQEVDSLADPSKWRINLNSDGETFELWVFQTKLAALMEKAWKPIPLFHPNQFLCLDIIRTGNFKRPHFKVFRIFERSISAYSGRKGFVDLMLGEGQVLEDIFVWMGHRSIETTWKYYKQKQIVRFRKRAA